MFSHTMPVRYFTDYASDEKLKLLITFTPATCASYTSMLIILMWDGEYFFRSQLKTLDFIHLLLVGSVSIPSSEDLYWDIVLLETITTLAKLSLQCWTEVKLTSCSPLLTNELASISSRVITQSNIEHRNSSLLGCVIESPFC